MTKNESTRLVAFIFVMSVLFIRVVAQEAGQSIDVPDVSTAIASETSTVDEESIPDFTLILPEPETDFLLTLDLPDENTISSESLVESASEGGTAFSLEGVVGGGYPGYFLGDINIFHNNEKNPFELHFSHVEQNGYGVHLASEGYTHAETNLFGETTFVFDEQYSLNLDALYETASTGFQSKSPLFYLSANQFVQAAADFEIITASGWEIDFVTNGKWLNRYLGHKSIIPETVNSSSNAFGVGAGFSFGKSFENANFLTQTQYDYFNLDLGHSHRVGINVDAQFSLMESLSLDSSVGLVYEQNLQVPVLIPFSLSLTYTIPTITVLLSGGMISEQIDFADIQKKYPFTHIAQSIDEQAQWFSNLTVNFPILENYSFSGDFYFDKTAFGQGALLPNYAQENSTTGLYDMQITDMLRFDSDFALSANYGVFGFLAGWDAAWLDVLPEENAHEIYVSASITSVNEVWGAQFTLKESFFSDYTPSIDLSAFISISPAFQLELQMQDFIKLVSGQDRTYAGNFVTDSGFVGFFARLYL